MADQWSSIKPKSCRIRPQKRHTQIPKKLNPVCISLGGTDCLQIPTNDTNNINDEFLSAIVQSRNDIARCPEVFA